VLANLRSQLTSWFQKLNNFFPEKLSFGNFWVGKNYFTAMAITKNY
jgi:hypothetical protein